MKLMRLGTLFGCLVLVPMVQALDSADRLVTVGFLETDGNQLQDTLFSATRYTSSGLIDTTWATGGIATVDLRHGLAMNAVFREDGTGNPDGVLAVGSAINPVHGKPQAVAVQFAADGVLQDIFWLQDPSTGPAERSIATDVIQNIDGDFYICGTVITSENRYQGFVAIMDNSGVLSDDIIGPLDVKINALTETTSGNPDNEILFAGKKIVNGTPRPLVINLNGDEFFLGSISGEFLDIDSGQDVTFSRSNATTPTRAPGNVIFAVGRHAHKGLLVGLNINGNIDTNFGSNGYVIEEIGNRQTSFNAIKVEKNIALCTPALVVCGTARSLQSHMFVAGYDVTGNRITSFGTDGVKTIFEGPNVQTIARDVLLPLSDAGCSSSGIFAVGSAESPKTISSPANLKNQTPLIAKLANITGSLETDYGDKGIASLATEENTAMTVLKESIAPAVPVNLPVISRLFDLLEGNPFAVSLSGPSGAFTLQPGRYVIDIEAPAFDIDMHQLSLGDIASAEILANGDVTWNGSGIFTKALLKTQLFLSQPSDLAVAHTFSGAGANASFGEPAGFAGLPDRFAQMSIQQL